MWPPTRLSSSCCPARCSTKSCGFHCRPQLEGARQEHQLLRNEPAECESYWPSVEPHSSCPQLEGAREEQQFLRDETAELQARFSELYAEVKEAPNARAEQRAQRSVQEAERQVKSFGSETLLKMRLIEPTSSSP